MGLLSHVAIYAIGKSRGKRSKTKKTTEVSGDPDCLNFSIFCKNSGSCGGNVCEYEHDVRAAPVEKKEIFRQIKDAGYYPPPDKRI